MNKIRFSLMLLLMSLSLSVMAQKKQAQMRFDDTSIDFGTFSMDNPVRKGKFKFHNVGKARLVINFVQTSCGCTVADFPKDPIAPGGEGEIQITYNGKGKMPGKFMKTITVYSNSDYPEMKLMVKGDMTAVPGKKK